MVWVNQSNNIDSKLLFGGYEQSGTGRELGESGLDEYLEEKAVHVTICLRLLAAVKTLYTLIHASVKNSNHNAVLTR
jgi:hypothetical protein